MKERFFWIYLDPYTFIFSGDYIRVVYNTLNSNYLEYADSEIINILDALLIPENGYCVPISISLLKKNNVRDFIKDLRKSFSGDIILDRDIEKDNKPFIFMPLLRMYNNVQKMKERKAYLGENILRNICEFTCYLPGECSKKCVNCKNYYKQMVHCTNHDYKISLTINDYIDLCQMLDTCGVGVVNFIVNSSNINELREILNETRFLKLKKVVYIAFDNVNDEIMSVASLCDRLYVNIDYQIDDSLIIDIIRKYQDLCITWVCIIENEAQISKVENISTYCNIEMQPFYNGNNSDFFKKYIYTELEDIISSPIDKKTIFRRHVLNENFFGKLYLFPSGDVFANLNSKSIGNLKKCSLMEIVFNEFDESTSWLLTREANCVCAKCINKYLCPSISNYEMYMNKFDLCYKSLV